MKKSFRKRKAESDEESDKEVGEEDTEILKRIKQYASDACVYVVHHDLMGTRRSAVDHVVARS